MSNQNDANKKTIRNNQLEELLVHAKRRGLKTRRVKAKTKTYQTIAGVIKPRSRA